MGRSWSWAALILGALLWRVLIASWTPIPSQDGISYLWMAERLAQGDVSEAVRLIFPPLLPACAAPWIAMGADPFRAVQGVSILAGLLALWPVVAVARRIAGENAAWFAAWIYISSPLPVRFAAECYTEPLFILLSALAVQRGLDKKWWSLGLLAGLSFWLRQEGPLIALAFVMVHPRSAWRSLLPVVLFVVGLMVWRGVAGHGWALTMRVEDLNWQRGVPGADGVGAALALFGGNLVQIPWLWVEAFGVAGVLAAWGMLRRRRPGAAELLVLLGLGICVICCFLPRRRFLVGWTVVAVAFATAGLVALPRWRQPALVITVVVSLLLGLRTTDPNRQAERQVGEHLRGLLRPGELVTGDLPRVIYYAGMVPLPPRHFTLTELESMARSHDVRFVLLAEHRAGRADLARRLQPVFEPLALPSELQTGASARGILVLRRQ